MIGNLLAICPDQVEAIFTRSKLLSTLLYSENTVVRPDNHLNIEKTWHAIHYTLNGSTWGGEGPLSWVILGGQEIGEDVGYGPARYLTPTQVKAIAAALATISSQTFVTQLDPAAMDAAEIYPQGWESAGQDGLDYVVQYYDQLSLFYRTAAESGNAVLVYLN